MKRNMIVMGTLTLMLMLMVSIVPMGSVRAATTPTVVIAPDNNLAPSETETVQGTGMLPNVSVSISLILPDGQRVDGVASGMTNSAGAFAITFVAPDRSGDGYVIATVNGTQSFSLLVKYVGLKPNTDLRVAIYPDTPTTNATVRIQVSSDALTGKNYVLVVQTTYPTNELTTSYYVLHDGLCNIEKVYSVAGTYSYNVSVDTTNIVKKATTTLTYKQANNNGNNQNQNWTGDVNWTVDKNLNVYTISLIKGGIGTVLTGQLKVKKPDATEGTMVIINGQATLNADQSGDYMLTYMVGDKAFTKTVSYSPSIVLRASQFTATGSTTLTLTVDGKAPTTDVECLVTGDGSSTQDTTTISKGIGTYAAQQPDSFTFSVDYLGTTTTTHVTYSDIYIISSLSALQSNDKATLTISGTLTGQRSARGIANAQVKITIDFLGYSNNAKTGTDGSFRAIIPLSTDSRGDLLSGTTITVKAQYGTGDASETTTKLTHDFWGEWGFTIVIIIIVIFGILWVTGILTRFLPFIPKPFDGGGGGSGGGIFGGGGGSGKGSKVLMASRINLKPPKQQSGG